MTKCKILVPITFRDVLGSFMEEYPDEDPDRVLYHEGEICVVSLLDTDGTSLIYLPDMTWAWYVRNENIQILSEIDQQGVGDEGIV